jgi:hypothetical protein
MRDFLLHVISFLLLTLNLVGQTTEIYVSDAGNFNNPPWQILKFDENGENPEVFIDSNLAWPQDIIFLDDQGLVLISNLNTNQITKYNLASGGYLGNFATGISGPTRMKIGDDSLLYVLQWSGDGKVRRYQLNGTFVDDFTSVGVSQSIGIDWDSTGNLYVSSFNGNNVRKFDSNGNDMGLFINSNLQGPTNIWFDDNGDLLVLNWSGTTVKRFDSAGNYLGDFITGLFHCEGVDVFPNGNILIGNGGTSSVKLFDSNGNYLEDFIASGAGNLLTPNAVVIRQNVSVSISEGDNTSGINQFILKQNYPNPFNPSTQIEFSIPGPLHVKLEIFNMLGERMDVLVSQSMSAGEHSIEWNAEEVPSGIYMYRLTAGDRIESRKMVLLR